MDSDSPYKKTYVYIPNFLLEGNRPKITMESDSPYTITYVYIWPIPIYLLYVLKKNWAGGLKIDFLGIPIHLFLKVHLSRSLYGLYY